MYKIFINLVRIFAEYMFVPETLAKRSILFKVKEEDKNLSLTSEEYAVHSTGQAWGPPR